MSDIQQEVLKLKAERDLLTHELQMLKTAIQPTQAAEKLIQSMNKSQDPLLAENNEWVTAAGGGDACCSVM